MLRLANKLQNIVLCNLHFSFLLCFEARQSYTANIQEPLLCTSHRLEFCAPAKRTARIKKTEISRAEGVIGDATNACITGCSLFPVRMRPRTQLRTLGRCWQSKQGGWFGCRMSALAGWVVDGEPLNHLHILRNTHQRQCTRSGRGCVLKTRLHEIMNMTFTLSNNHPYLREIQ